jgi:hypothetical protein
MQTIQLGFYTLPRYPITASSLVLLFLILLIYATTENTLIPCMHAVRAVKAHGVAVAVAVAGGQR